MSETMAYLVEMRGCVAAVTVGKTPWEAVRNLIVAFREEDPDCEIEVEDLVSLQEVGEFCAPRASETPEPAAGPTVQEIRDYLRSERDSWDGGSSEFSHGARFALSYVIFWIAGHQSEIG